MVEMWEFWRHRRDKLKSQFERGKKIHARRRQLEALESRGQMGESHQHEPWESRVQIGEKMGRGFGSPAAVTVVPLVPNNEQ